MTLYGIVSLFDIIDRTTVITPYNAILRHIMPKAARDCSPKRMQNERAVYCHYTKNF
jgi:hypothetical protein